MFGKTQQLSLAVCALLSLLAFFWFSRAGVPLRRSFPRPNKAYLTWPEHIHATEQCRRKYADFVRPRHTPQAAPSISFADRKAKCVRVLVVVIFNSPLYDHVPFLRKLYEPFFSSVVFYGTNESAKFNVRAAKETPGYFGDYQHFVISQATVEFPGYDGYMWIADDLIFNFKEALPSLDPNKLWFSIPYYGHKASPNIHEDRVDWHWNKTFGLPAVRSLYGCIPGVYTSRSSQWFGGPERVTVNVADFGYIPRRFVDDFRILSYSLRSVFMEITLPTAFFMMSNSTDDFQVVCHPPFKAQWLWEAADRKNILGKLTNLTMFLHPVKLYRNATLQQTLVAKMNREWKWSERTLNAPWLHCK